MSRVVELILCNRGEPIEPQLLKNLAITSSRHRLKHKCAGWLLMHTPKGRSDNLLPNFIINQKKHNLALEVQHPCIPLLLYPPLPVSQVLAMPAANATCLPGIATAYLPYLLGNLVPRFVNVGFCHVHM